MIACGIDPGLDGAVAVLTESGRLELYQTPVLAADRGGKRSFDLEGMRGLLNNIPWDGGLVVLEKVASRPGMSAPAVFNFANGYGMWQGLMAGLRIPYQLVTPQKWKGIILAGTKKDKQAAIEFVTRRFPGVSLLATPRSRVPHDGYADSACLALYARILLNGK